MKAMVFAAGMGSRLKPMTDEMPKALIPIGGKPMLEHIILRLKAAGFSHIVVNIHHFGEQIIDFLASKNNFGLKIDISDERKYLMDTGGGIKQAINFLKDDKPFLVHNADIFSNVDLKAMYEDHLRTNALATLLVHHQRTARQLMFDKKGRLHGWRNRETGEVKSFYPNFDPSQYMEYAFGGIHVISPEIFPLMEEWTGKFSIINFYLSVCPKIDIRPYTEDGLQLMDIGKPETLKDAEKWLKEHTDFL